MFSSTRNWEISTIPSLFPIIKEKNTTGIILSNMQYTIFNNLSEDTAIHSYS